MDLSGMDMSGMRGVRGDECVTDEQEIVDVESGSARGVGVSGVGGGGDSEMVQKREESRRWWQKRVRSELV
jgi:hypothetical protein